MPKQKSKRLRAAEAEHAQFLKSVGFRGKPKESPHSIPDYSTRQEVPSRTLEQQFPCGAVGAKTSIFDHHWRRPAGRPETRETIDGIQRKSEAVAPAYNKGAYQYVTPGSDLSDLGRKK